MGLGGHAEVYDAEMAALSIGAKIAAEYLLTHPHITHIALFTDNAAATTAISDPRPQAAQCFAIKFHNTVRPLLEMHATLSVSISWCPSHCKIRGNDRADELAKEATRKERQTDFSVSRSNARRRSKNIIRRIWETEWKKQPLNGRYAIANRFPPSLQPTPHFRELANDRELFGRVTQCRIGHAYTGEFRQTFLPHLDEPNTCPCDNETPQTRDHILRDCTKYEQHRNALRKVSGTVALPEILGTRKGIQALSAFLKKTGAFTRNGSPRQPPQTPALENEPETEPDPQHDPDGDG
jgi:ribonuclease HI